MKKFLSVLVLSVAGAVCAEAWPNGARCAVTYTFDDGLADQYTIAYPMFKENGLKATFFLVGSRIDNPSGFRNKVERDTPTMTWEMVRDLAANGMEIASHGLNHLNCGRLSNAQIAAEVEGNRKLIQEKADVSVKTFAYPKNVKKNKDGTNIVAFVESFGLVGSRTYQKSAGGGMTAERMNAMVEGAAQKGEWLVFMTHGMARGYDAWKDPEELRKHLEWVKARKDVWVGTFAEVSEWKKRR